MNILTSKLPDFVCLDGKKYRVHTDFRCWIDIAVLLTEKKDDIMKSIALVLEKAYIDLPPSINLAMQGIIDFYRADSENRNEKTENSYKKSSFSYEYDAVYILSAFKEQFGIDLRNAKMHWFEFLAYFKSLNENVQLMKIIQYRTYDLSQIKDKKQKAFIRKMKDMYALPDFRTQEEKEAEIINALDEIF